ncbi:MAG: hypothetical protein ACI9HY_000342 [Planctomycetaceae bacterium]|jgi:hypothetical protein
MSENTVYVALFNGHDCRDTIACHVQGASRDKYLSHNILHIATHSALQISIIVRPTTNTPLLPPKVK